MQKIQHHKCYSWLKIKGYFSVMTVQHLISWTEDTPLQEYYALPINESYAAREILFHKYKYFVPPFISLNFCWWPTLVQVNNMEILSAKYLCHM